MQHVWRTAAAISSLISAGATASETRTFFYDPVGRVARTTQSSSSGSVSASQYRYDQADNRAMVVSGTNGVGTNLSDSRNWSDYLNNSNYGNVQIFFEQANLNKYNYIACLKIATVTAAGSHNISFRLDRPAAAGSLEVWVGNGNGTTNYSEDGSSSYVSGGISTAAGDAIGICFKGDGQGSSVRVSQVTLIKT